MLEFEQKSKEYGVEDMTIEISIKDGEAIRKEWIDIDFCRKIEKLIDEYKNQKYR